MSGILIYSEAESTTLGLLSGVREMASDLGKRIAVALLGEEAASWTEACFAHGADYAFWGNDPALTIFQAATYATALSQIVTQAESDIILIGATRRGRELAPRLAQKLSAGCVTDANKLLLQDGQLIIERRALGGNTISACVITSPQQVISVMPNLFSAESIKSNVGEVFKIALELEPTPIRLVDYRSKETGTVNIEEARILVCAGRGLNEQGDLSLVQDLADALGGVLGCTRPLSHENRWFSEDQMIGLSGKVSSPNLYVGVGVSGQIQHTVGIMDAKLIVAINSDRNAPIFKIADYGIIGDLYQVVPRLVEQLQVE